MYSNSPATVRLEMSKHESEWPTSAAGRQGGGIALRLRWPVIGLGAGALLAALVYTNSLSGDFVWDDRRLIVDDRAIKSWSHIDDIFSHDFFERNEDDLPYGYYRPVTTLSYLVDYSVWGLRPFGYHLTNVLLHCACTVLVGLVLLRLGWPAVASILAALLFAIHPLHTENVAWVAGRTDLLAFFFSAVSLLLHLAADPPPAAGERPLPRGRGSEEPVSAARPVRRQSLLRVSVLLFAAALLAKEMAVVLVLWLVLLHLLIYRDDGRRIRRALVPYLVVIAAYAVWRFVLVDVPLPGGSEHHSFPAALLCAGALVVRYIGWLILPLHLNAYVQNPYVVSPRDPRFLAASFLLVVAVWWAYRHARRAPRAALAAGMLAAAFLPVLNLVRVAAPADMGNVMAERFCYFPSFPFVALVGLAAAAAIERTWARPAWRAAGVAGFGIIVALGAIATVRRNGDWHDERTFLTKTLAQSPSAVLLWSNLATYHLRKHQLDEGREALERAAAIDPESYWVRSARALWYVVNGRHAEAIPIQRAIVEQAKHGHAQALNNLAYLYRVTGREDEALEILEGLVAGGTAYADVYFNLAEIHRQRHQPQRAREYYRRALEDRPDNRSIATAWAAFELDADRPEEAERIDRGLLAMYPDDPRVLNNLALIRHRIGDTAGAVEILSGVVGRHPDYVNARINYAQLLHSSGHTSEAIAQLDVARQLAAGTHLEGVAARDLEELRQRIGAERRDVETVPDPAPEKNGEPHPPPVGKPGATRDDG